MKKIHILNLVIRFTAIYRIFIHTKSKKFLKIGRSRSKLQAAEYIMLIKSGWILQPHTTQSQFDDREYCVCSVLYVRDYT